MEYRKVDYVVGVGFDAQPIIVTHNIELETEASDADADGKGDCK